MRDSVLFYRSFYDALKNVPPDERLRVYDSIMEYAMYDNEPDLDGVALAIFLLAKPQIDANNKRYANGCRPKSKRNDTETEAKDKQSVSKMEAKDKQSVSKMEAKEKEKVKENVKEKDNTYSCAFEALWAAYPRKKEKANAYKCYKARLADGFSEDELMTAVKRYADECKARGTEARYIKLGSTFLSSNTPFADYLGDYKPEDTGQGTMIKNLNNFDHRRYSEDMLAALQDN